MTDTRTIKWPRLTHTRTITAEITYERESNKQAKYRCRQCDKNFYSTAVIPDATCAKCAEKKAE